MLTFTPPRLASRLLDASPTLPLQGRVTTFCILRAFANRATCDVEPASRCRVVLRLTIAKEATMPIILWLLGVPLSLVIILALLGVF